MSQIGTATGIVQFYVKQYEARLHRSSNSEYLVIFWEERCHDLRRQLALLWRGGPDAERLARSWVLLMRKE